MHSCILHRNILDPHDENMRDAGQACPPGAGSSKSAQNPQRIHMLLTKCVTKKSGKVASFCCPSRYLNVQDIQGAEIRHWPMLCLLATAARP